MNKERQIKNTSETIRLAKFAVIIDRAPSGLITGVRSTSENQPLELSQDDLRIVGNANAGSVTIEKQPPAVLQRNKSGHLSVPIRRQNWVLDINSETEALTTTIPVLKIPKTATLVFTARENAKTKLHPLIPFSLEIEHPDLLAPKTEVLSVLQIFGHISAAARILNAMPIDMQKVTSLAAKNRDNVPKVFSQITEFLGRSDFALPLTYDDSVSGGEHITDRKAALWWLTQNPELVDKAMLSKVIISDFREEVALLKHLAECQDLPQIFLGLTYAWPQRLNEAENLPPDMEFARNNIPGIEQKLASMARVGLTADDASPDWFTLARRWKAGVRNNHAHSVDLLATFSLVNPQARNLEVENAVIFPPRTHLEIDSQADQLWHQNDKRVLVLMGSGDWTERQTFVKNIVLSASLIQDSEIILVGEKGDIIFDKLPKNISVLGIITPAQVDGLIKSCNIAVIKPGHFSLEETAGKLTLIAPPDNLENSIAISEQTDNPRSVAITVEVDEERLTTAFEQWLALDSPKYFSPLLNISSSQTIANKITEALDNEARFKSVLSYIPHGGTEELINLINQLLSKDFTRNDIPNIVNLTKRRMESFWLEREGEKSANV